MGGCQSASDDSLTVPKKLNFSKENKFTKLEKHKFNMPALTTQKLQLASSCGNKRSLYRKNHRLYYRKSS